MAELVVFNIAKSLLEQLSSPAKDELLLLYNSKTELEKLKNTVISIRDVLQDAEQRQTTDAAVKTWLSRLRDEMYEADDLFDSISTRALRRQVMSGNKIIKEAKLLLSKPKDAAFNISTVHKVKELRERMDSIAKDITQFGFMRRTVVDERPIVKRKAQSHSYIPGDELIGREKEKGELLRLLLEDGDDAKQRVSVIAVVGIGGQGKTSLAQHLYNAKKTEEFFGLRLWACVNDFSDLKVVLEEVTGVKTVGLDKLQNILRKKIHGKRFLLVLDDVWDDIRERWLGLKRLLDAGDRGSKILITTRLRTVARNLGTGTPFYNLRGLSDEHSWLLFQKMAFENDQEKDYQIKEEIGRNIVKKCANVPLAIRTIASYLYSKDKKHWSELADNHVMNTMRDHPQNMIMAVLKISYDDLPSSLKHCFAYCSLFPKDHRFDKTALIHLWMAQGLLQTSDVNECLEDVGEKYFEYLVHRCFFQDIREVYAGRTFCKMHDLFHDMAVQIGGTECVQMKKPEDIRGKSFRHLLVCDIEGLPLLHGSGIRSLVSPFTGFAKESLLEEVFLKFTSLRTLSLLNLDVDKIPSSVGNLVHLRYLDLRESVKLKRLPDALCKLHNLLILRLGGCSSLINLPDGLHKLKSLRYLEIEGCDELNHMPPGLERLTSLVMLDRLVVSKEDGGLRFLKHLNNLTGSLRIELPKDVWKNCVVDAEESILRCKTKLNELHMSFGESTTAADLLSDSDEDALINGLQPANTLSSLGIVFFRGGKFPNWLSLTNLAELALWGCRNCVELPRMRELYQLKLLRLGQMDLVEYVVSDTCYHSEPFFPALESLRIMCMPRLKGWGRSNVGEVCFGNQLSFARLSDLKLQKCPQLTCFPLCPVVETLRLDEVNVKVVEQLLREPQTREDEANNCVDLPSSSTLQTCSKLRTLTLSGIQGLALLPDEFKLFHALCHLSISDCLNMKRNSMLCSLQHLPSLEFLTFKGSSEIELHDDETSGMEEGMPWISLTRLKRLWFKFGSDPKGAHLIKGLHHLTMLFDLAIHKNVADEFDTKWTAPPNVTSLQFWYMDKLAGLNGLIQQLKRLHALHIIKCDVDEHELDKLPWEDLKGLRHLTFTKSKMKSLPEKCRHLTSLESLLISSCSKLSSLPTWVSQLMSLDVLDCPEVVEKCRKPTGSYWPLIRDIPHLGMGG